MTAMLTQLMCSTQHGLRVFSLQMLRTYCKLINPVKQIPLPEPCLGKGASGAPAALSDDRALPQQVEVGFLPPFGFI